MTGWRPVLPEDGSLAGIRALSPDPVVDEKAQEEERQYRAERQRLANRDIEQNIALRQRYANRAYCMALSWLVFVAGVLVVSRLRISRVVPFSDAVLITLITTSTVNVLGLFVIVLKYLFPPPAKPNA